MNIFLLEPINIFDHAPRPGSQERCRSICHSRQLLYSGARALRSLLREMTWGSARRTFRCMIAHEPRRSPPGGNDPSPHGSLDLKGRAHLEAGCDQICIQEIDTGFFSGPSFQHYWRFQRLRRKDFAEDEAKEAIPASKSPIGKRTSFHRRW
jgi:hypothetical protein